MVAYIVRQGNIISGYQHESYVGTFKRTSISTQEIARKIMCGNLGNDSISKKVLTVLRTGNTNKLYKLPYYEIGIETFLLIKEDAA